MKLSLLLSLFVLIHSMNAAVAIADNTPPGESFEFSVKNNGDFSLTLHADIAPGVSLDDTRRILTNPDHLREVSKIVNHVEVNQTDAEKSALTTVWGRYHDNYKLISDCTESVSPNHFEENCQLRMKPTAPNAKDQGDAAKLFVSGGTSTECVRSANDKISCDLKSFGISKPFHVLVFKFTPSDIALNGAGFNLHDMALLIEMINHNQTAAHALQVFGGSNLEALVNALHDELEPKINLIPNGQVLEASGDARIGMPSFHVGVHP